MFTTYDRMMSASELIGFDHGRHVFCVGLWEGGTWWVVVVAGDMVIYGVIVYYTRYKIYIHYNE